MENCVRKNIKNQFCKPLSHSNTLQSPIPVLDNLLFTRYANDLQNNLNNFSDKLEKFMIQQTYNEKLKKA